MKKFRNGLMGLILIMGMVLINIIPVNAAGSATLSFDGASTASVGDTITLTMKLASTSSPVAGIQGTISYDSEYLEFISSNVLTTLTGSYSANIFLAYDGTGSNPINSGASLLSLTFKAKKNGTTVVKMNESMVSDTSGNEITASDPSKTITIGEASIKSSDATLKSLTSSNGTLSPSFNGSTTTYEMQVGSSTNTVNFTGVTNSTSASITSGTTCNLSSNPTSCKIVVKAEDGTTKTYTVNVTKSTSGGPTNPGEDDPGSDLSSDATLKSLDVSGYTLSPVFKSGTNTYTMNVASTVGGLKVTAVPNSDKATVEVTGNTNFVEGMNTIRIKVTAEDGTTNTYIVNVNKKASGTNNTQTTTKSSDNYLKSLSITNGDISPAFSKNVSNYSITVPNNVNKLDLTAIPNSTNAKVKINGNSDLKIGSNVVTVEVTAEDGSVRIYTINVTKSSESSNNKLSELTITGYPIPFDKDKYEYEITVPNDVDSIDINAKSLNSNAKIEIVGNKDLKEGNNTVLVKVTDENGFTQYYKIDVYKNAKNDRFLGFTFGQWLLLGGLILGTLLLLGLVIFLIFKKKDDDEEEKTVSQTPSPQTPIIEFKPEFNFSSKNGTDDDYVSPGGVLNQYSGALPKEEDKKVIEANYRDTVEDATLEEIPYDPYDDIVTKDELYDALEESIESKDISKLKMLYEQEKLNREKEKIKKREDRYHE